MKDQFVIFRKTADTYNSEEIRHAIEYCSERELYNATDFRDTLVYFQGLEPVVYTPDEFQIPPKYSQVVAEERNINNYCKIYGGNNK